MLNTSKIDKFIGGCNNMPKLIELNGKIYQEVSRGSGIVGGTAKVGELTKKGEVRGNNKNKGRKKGELNEGLKMFNEKVKILRERTGMSQKEAQKELKGSGIVGGKKKMPKKVNLTTL